MYSCHYSHGTSHISTADGSGMAFSLTTTINGFFGSHVMVPESGVIMNNQMNGNLYLRPISARQALSHLHTPLASALTFISFLCRCSRNTRTNTIPRFLHSARAQRIWLCPVASELHPPQQTPPLIHYSNYHFSPVQQDPPFSHWGCRGLSHYHRYTSSRLKPPRAQHEYSRGHR